MLRCAGLVTAVVLLFAPPPAAAQAEAQAQQGILDLTVRSGGATVPGADVFVAGVSTATGPDGSVASRWRPASICSRSLRRALSRRAPACA